LARDAKIAALLNRELADFGNAARIEAVGEGA
jgi:hypothetical protein